MSTRKEVPRADGEGAIGKPSKYWGNGYFKNLNVDTSLNMSGAINENLTTMASATTMNIGAAIANYIIVTGTITITAFDSIQAGAIRRLRFSNTVTINYNATTMILPGAINIVAYAGDVLTFVSGGGGIWRCIDVQRYNKFRGCNIYRGSGGAQSVAANTTTKVVLNTVGFDTTSFWDSTNSRISIPAGVSMVNIYAAVYWNIASTTNLSLCNVQIRLNGNIVGYVSAITTTNNILTRHQVFCPCLPVNLGDYIELYAFNGDTATKTILADAYGTYLTMEVIV